MKRLIIFLLCLYSFSSTILANENANSTDDITQRINQVTCDNYKITLLAYKQICEDTSQDTVYAKLLLDYGSLCYTMADYDSAIIAVSETTDIYSNVFGNNSIKLAMPLAFLAQCHSNKGNFETAIQLCSKGIRLFQSSAYKKRSEYVYILRILSLSHSNLDHYREAIKYGLEEMEIYKKSHNTMHPNYAALLSNLSIFYYHIGDIKNAIEFGIEALDIYNKSDPNELSFNITYAAILTNLSTCYIFCEEYDKAINYASKALDIYKNTHAIDSNYAAILNNLSTCYCNFSDYKKATEYAYEALVINKNLHNDIDYAMTLSQLAICLLYDGEYEKALEYGTEAITCYHNSHLTEHINYAILLSALYGYYSETRNYEKAIEYAMEALKIFENSQNTRHPNYITTISNLSIYFYEIGDFEKAIEYGEKAHEIFKQKLLHFDLIDENALSVFYTLAICYFKVGLKHDALQLIEESIPILHKSVLHTFTWLTTDERSTYWEPYSYALGSVIPRIFIDYSVDGNASLLYDYSSLFSKGLLLSTELEITKIIQESGDVEALQMYTELQHNRQLLNVQYTKPKAERQIDCDSLEGAASKLERQLVTRVKEFGDYTRNLSITWRDVQNKLDDNDIAIEFLCYPELDGTIVYAALSLCKNDTTPVLTQLFVETQLLSSKSIEETYQTALTDALVWGGLSSRLEGKSRVYFSASGMLHNIGVEYLPSMEGKDCHRLSSTRELVTHKPSPTLGSSTTATLYGYIDYNATYSSIDSITANSAYYSSSPLNIDLAQSSEQSLSEANDSIATNDDNNLPAIIDSQSSLDNDILLPGVNQNRGGFDYRSLRYEVDSLPGSRVEVQTISTLLDSIDVAYVRLMTNQASEESFKALSGQRKSLIHISTHGFYYDQEEAENKAEHMRRMLLGDDRPTHVEDQSLLRCGLCFAGANQTFKGESQPSDGQDDGVLNALEIAQTDLRGLDLVVLSACQTGLGDIVNGKGVFGLQRGFKKAGAQSILMSLWEVDDKVTQILMTEFYRAWTSGMNKTAALKKAQSIVKEKYPDPKHWASFILLDAID